jgi:hypothetical protein
MPCSVATFSVNDAERLLAKGPPPIAARPSR